MGKKLGLVIAAIALLFAGAIGGMKFAGDNRGTVVGDSSRYRVEASGRRRIDGVGRRFGYGSRARGS